MNDIKTDKQPEPDVVAGQREMSCYARGCLAVASIFTGVWLFFYNFHVFPTPIGELYWWAIPNLFTTFAICYMFVMYGCYTISRLLANQKDNKISHNGSC